MNAFSIQFNFRISRIQEIEIVRILNNVEANIGDIVAVDYQVISLEGTKSTCLLDIIRLFNTSQLIDRPKMVARDEEIE